MSHLTLSVLPERFAVCKLGPQAELPEWATLGSSLWSITRTTDELSIICSQENIPAGFDCDREWRAFKLEGPFAFGLVGILLSALTPLAEAGISILAISTYDTDYVLVKADQLEHAISALLAAGHTVNR